MSGVWKTFTQTVDAAGEITKQHGTASTTTYTYNSEGDRVKAVSGATTTTYTFNQANQMTSAGQSGSRSTYVYDGMGNEAAYKSQGASTETQLVWADPTGLGTLTLLYSNSIDYFVYGPGITPVEQYNVTASPPSANPVFLNYGGQDGFSSYYVTKTTGKLTKAYTYGPYGTMTTTPGTVFGFVGEYTDSAGASPSKLVNMRARWYQGTSGTFMSVDPMVSETFQPYVYAENDPIDEIDPSGRYVDVNCAANAPGPWEHATFLTCLWIAATHDYVYWIAVTARHNGGRIWAPNEHLDILTPRLGVIKTSMSPTVQPGPYGFCWGMKRRVNGVWLSGRYTARRFGTYTKLKQWTSLTLPIKSNSPTITLNEATADALPTMCPKYGQVNPNPVT